VPTKNGRTTLATVAASAGVSVATVSKVVNGRADVGPKTRALVESLLRKHEYVGRRPAPERRSAATARVELMFAGDLNAYSVEILQGVLAAGTEVGAAVAVSVRAREPRRVDADRAGAWARDLRAAGRQAVIAVVNELTPADIAALSRAHLPLVVIDPLNLPRARVTSVGSTNFAGGIAATQHLLALGHRRIGYLGGPVSAACNQARLHGYRAAMEAAGAPVPDGYVRTGNFRYQDGLVGGAALFDLPEPPTAVFAGSDETAAGVIEAARSRGLRIPEDLSIVGFDDTEVARHASPPLTTVRQPLRELGGVALRTALRLAAGEKLDSHHVELATELIVRRSTAPPPA
jgi:LacI family transcriptional regulator, galactose operon repressor